MSAPKFELSGFNELIATLKELGGERLAKKANRRAVRLAATPILEAARANAPVDKGDLKAAMSKKVYGKGYQINAIIGADAEYVAEDGSKPAKYDFHVEYGHQEPGGEAVAPHPFLRTAFDATHSAALDKYGQVLAEEIEKAASKGGK